MAWQKSMCDSKSSAISCVARRGMRNRLLRDRLKGLEQPQQVFWRCWRLWDIPKTLMVPLPGRSDNLFDIAYFGRPSQAFFGPFHCSHQEGRVTYSSIHFARFKASSGHFPYGFDDLPNGAA